MKNLLFIISLNLFLFSLAKKPAIGVKLGLAFSGSKVNNNLNISKIKNHYAGINTGYLFNPYVLNLLCTF